MCIFQSLSVGDIDWSEFENFRAYYVYSKVYSKLYSKVYGKLYSEVDSKLYSVK